MITAVIAGPQLWPLVEHGYLDSTVALERAGVVAAACTAGVIGIQRLMHAYDEDLRRAQQILEAAAQAGDLLEGTALLPGEVAGANGVPHPETGVGATIPGATGNGPTTGQAGNGPSGPGASDPGTATSASTGR